MIAPAKLDTTLTANAEAVLRRSGVSEPQKEKIRSKLAAYRRAVEISQGGDPSRRKRWLSIAWERHVELKNTIDII